MKKVSIQIAKKLIIEGKTFANAAKPMKEIYFPASLGFFQTVKEAKHFANRNLKHLLAKDETFAFRVNNNYEGENK